jgi:hypothetical protein
MAHPEVTADYTSASGADTTSFGNGAGSNAQPARWIQCYGSGNIVMLDNSATPTSRTYTVSGSETISGEWTSFVSTTLTRARIGTSWPPPPAMPNNAPVNLAGGAAVLTGILPAANVQPWADAGTFYVTGFNVAIQTVHPYNLQTQTCNINFPKITSAIDGLKVALVNHGTGATVSMLFPSGTDSIGVVANGVTAATAAGPKSLTAQTYTAVLQTGQWAPGI